MFFTSKVGLMYKENAKLVINYRNIRKKLITLIIVVAMYKKLLITDLFDC